MMAWVMRSGPWAAVAVAVVVGVGRAEPLPVAFAESVGQPAPASTPALAESIKGRRPVLLDFAGDAGPDRVKQDLVLNALLPRYERCMAVVRVWNETEDGDPVFDDYRVKRIPSLCVIGSDGRIATVFEGPVTAEALATALDRVLAAGGVAPPPATAPGASPARPGTPVEQLTGRALPLVTPAVAQAVAAGRPVALLFHADWGRYSREQVQVLERLRQRWGASVAIELVRDGTPEAVAAFSEFGVRAVPVLVIADSGGAVRHVFPRVASEGEVAACLEALLAAPAPPPAAQLLGEGETPEGSAELVGKRAVASTEILSYALQSERPTVVFFQRARDVQASEVAELLAHVKKAFAEDANVLTVIEGAPGSAAAWADYAVGETPAVVAIGADGVIKRVCLVRPPAEVLIAAIRGAIRP